MKVFFYNTVYSLLLYVLIVDDWKNSLFCISKNNTNQAIIDYFKKKGINYTDLYMLSHDKNIMEKIICKIKNYYILYMIYKKGTMYYGFDDYFFPRLFVGEKFCVIEDGFANYRGKNNIVSLINQGIMGYNKYYIPYGYDDKIKKIYLTGMFDIPFELREKSEIINIKMLWDRKSDEDKKDIFDLFGIKQEQFEIYKKKKIILLTQPLEFFGINEKRKIEIYHKILLNYSKSEVLIKVHPKEKTKYIKWFNEYDILEQRFPFELVGLIINVDKVVTISSTAAFSLGKSLEQIDIYDLGGNLNRTFSVESVIKESKIAHEIHKGILSQVRKVYRNYIERVIFFVIKKIK